MNMHTYFLCGVLAGSVVVAHAAEIDPPLSAQAPAGPGKTRAEVKAETLRALAAGEVSFGDVGYPQTRAASVAPFPGRSRAEVKAETRQALAAGEIPFGDAVYPKVATTSGVGLTRAEVKSELLRAIAAHEFQFSDSAYPDSGFVSTPRTRSRTKAVATSPASMPSMSMTPAS